MNQIPLFAVYVAPETGALVNDVLYSGQLAQGPTVEKYEAALCEFFDNPNVLTVNSGTTALQLALKLADVGPGDEVVSTPMTCSATNLAILHSGADIVWADVDRLTGLVTPESVERCITTRTKAVMVVHWGGTPCAMEHFGKMKLEQGFYLIEDAAHAFGADVNTNGGYERLGHRSLADFTCFSTQAIKALTSADGGILIAHNDEHFERGKRLRWFGIDRTETRSDFRIEADIPEAGYKWHLCDLLAAVGLGNLPHIEDLVDAHRENAWFYDEHLDSMFYPCATGVPESSYWLYTILIRPKFRDKFMEYMTEQGIQVSRVHARNDKHSCFEARARYGPDGVPGLDSFDASQVSIPVHWKLTKEDRERVVVACNKFAFANREAVVGPYGC